MLLFGYSLINRCLLLSNKIRNRFNDDGQEDLPTIGGVGRHENDELENGTRSIRCTNSVSCVIGFVEMLINLF